MVTDTGMQTDYSSEPTNNFTYVAVNIRGGKHVIYALKQKGEGMVEAETQTEVSQAEQQQSEDSCMRSDSRIERCRFHNAMRLDGSCSIFTL